MTSKEMSALMNSATVAAGECLPDAGESYDVDGPAVHVGIGSSCRNGRQGLQLRLVRAGQAVARDVGPGGQVLL